MVNDQRREMGDQQYKYSWTEFVKYGGIQEPHCLAIESLGARYWRAEIERLFSESGIVKMKLGANPLNRENSSAIFAAMMGFTVKGIVAVMRHEPSFWVS